MTVLLLGSQGQLGRVLKLRLNTVGPVVALSRIEADLVKAEQIEAKLQRFEPRIIVNAAAFNAVDQAEDDEAGAFAVNAAAPGVLARWAAAHDALLVHYSTDYVFDGQGVAPWREDGPVGPLSAYGRSKLAGEAAIQASQCRYWILRTSWLYGAQGKNFFRTIRQAAQQRDELRVVADQIGAPCTVGWLAEVTAQLLGRNEEPRQILHVTTAGETSWHGFASAIVDEASRRRLPVKARHIVPVSSAEWPARAHRPANSRLSLDKLRGYGFSPPHWREAMSAVFDQEQPE
jgi:dTDP-4-dehydrorhamnose reductase